MSTARVTVITRTRNRSDFLRRAVASVAAQTYRDFVHVIINDAGDPAAVTTVLDELSADDRSKIELYTNEVSAGREAAINSGLEHVHTHYYAIHDDDDSWSPLFLEKTVAYMDAHPEEGAVGVRTEVVRETYANGTFTENSREVLAGDKHDFSFLDTLVCNYVPPIAMLFRKDVTDEIGWFEGELPVLADWEYNIRLMASIAVGFIDDPVLAYWHHRESLDPDTGNSVVAAADDHTRYDGIIRDSYIRQSIEDGSLLGVFLGQGYYHREALKRLDRLEERINEVSTKTVTHEEMHLVFTALSQQLSRNNEMLTSIVNDVEQLRRRMKRAAGTLQRLERLLTVLANVTRPARRFGGRVRDNIKRHRHED